MRTSGVLDAPRGLAAGDHVCWLYDDDGDRSRTIAAFLADGLRQGQRLGFVTAGSPDDARRALEPLGDVESLIGCGALEVRTIADTYVEEPAAHAAQVEAYAAAVRRAVAAGFSGLRVAADVTPLVCDPGRRSAFADYEHLVDAYMTGAEFTAMCCYDRRVLGAAAQELACLHPAGNDGELPFRCFAAGDGGLCLSGEVDILSAGALATALGHAAPGHPDALRVDGRELRFIDHRGLLALAAAAGRVELVTGFAAAATVRELLGLSNLAVQVPG